MPGAVPYFFKVFPYLPCNGSTLQCKTVEAYNGIHGGADLMAHAGQKGSFGSACLFSGCQRFAKGLVFSHGFPHFRIDDRKSHAYCVNYVIIPVFRMPYSGKADHFVIFPAGSLCQIAEYNDRILRKSFTHMNGIDEFQEILPVVFRNEMLPIP